MLASCRHLLTSFLLPFTCMCREHFEINGSLVYLVNFPLVLIYGPINSGVLAFFFHVIVGNLPLPNVEKSASLFMCVKMGADLI